MTAAVAFVMVAAAAVAWLAVARWRARAEALRDPGPRHPSRRRVPGLFPDGEPLTAEENDEFTGVGFASWFRPAREPKDGSPPGGHGQDDEEEAR